MELIKYSSMLTSYSYYRTVCAVVQKKKCGNPKLYIGSWMALNSNFFQVIVLWQQENVLQVAVFTSFPSCTI